MRKLIFILTITILYTGGCLSSGTGSYQANYNFGKIDKIAIVAVEGQIQNKDAKAQLADVFIMELLNKGYAPIPLNQVEARVREEAESSKISVPQQDAYTRIGQILKVPAVLVIKVPYINDEIFITAQLIDTQDGGVLWMNQASGDIADRGREISTSNNYGRNREDYLMDPLLMYQEPQKPIQSQELPENSAGKMFNPMELQKTRLIVSKVCSSLPACGTPATSTAIFAPKTKTKTRTTSDW
jgi:TolB-like protein